MLILMKKKIKIIFKKVLDKIRFKSEYFAQCGEDAVLYGIFYKKIKRGEKGVFVDVGAYHPIIYSNTYFFYKLGWRGINIDACPGSMKKFIKKRPYDTNLEIGIDEIAGESTFYVLNKKSTMNTFSKSNLQKHNMLDMVQKEVKVKTSTIEEILDNYLENQEIDFLNVDAEGVDFKVLKSNNWLKYRPNVIIVEIQCKDIEDVKANETSKFLLDLDYKIIAKNVISSNLASVFFVRKDFDY